MLVLLRRDGWSKIFCHPCWIELANAVQQAPSALPRCFTVSWLVRCKNSAMPVLFHHKWVYASSFAFRTRKGLSVLGRAVFLSGFRCLINSESSVLTVLLPIFFLPVFLRKPGLRLYRGPPLIYIHNFQARAIPEDPEVICALWMIQTAGFDPSIVIP